MASVMLVEDDRTIGEPLSRALSSAGHRVHWVTTGHDAEVDVFDVLPDIVLLDLGLPDVDGIEVCRRIRQSHPDTPILMLTARREEMDVVEGLDAGAVDYVTKPFSFDELAARVRAHLRAPTQAQPTRLEGLGIQLDLLTRRVTRDGHEVALSTKEFDLLAYFLRHPANVLSREQILSAVWGYSHDPGTNIVEVYVSYLRRKLGRPGSPAPIVTVRSVGYRLAPTRA